MNTKSFLMSGIAGTFVCFLLGWLFYGILFPDVYPQNDEECMLFIFLGCLFYAFTFALIFNRWAQISTFSSGIKAGFLLGLLWSLSMSFFMYASKESIDSNFLILIAIDAVSAAIMGGIIALVIGKTKA
ncbi:MAG: Uncharacterised protein [Formosa sp. Hel1_33_131]|nr:MAG: Uncharacterised protein [Formosa sp. Hel1_33_131]